MSKVLNPMMTTFQNEANSAIYEYVMLNHSRDVYYHYQSLVKGSERISAGITDSRGADLLDELQTEPQARMSSNFPQSSIEGGMAKRTLGGIIEAGETAAKVMRFRV